MLMAIRRASSLYETTIRPEPCHRDGWVAARRSSELIQRPAGAIILTAESRSIQRAAVRPRFGVFHSQ
jgi:hypothetical protein